MANRYILVLLFLVCTNSFAADIVKWKDADGTVHYSDQVPASSQSKPIPISSGAKALSGPPYSDASSNPQSEKNATGSANAGVNSSTRIDDADAIPYLTSAARAKYREFLSHSSPRAFVICPDGRFLTMYVVGNYQEKLNKLLQQRPAGCEPYVINDAVVWAGK